MYATLITEYELNSYFPANPNQLNEIIQYEGHDGHILGRTIQLISNEILSRQIKESSKPHWTAYAVLLLTFIAAVTGVVAILK